MGRKTNFVKNIGSENTAEGFKALRDHMAAKLEKTESGRDYAAITKSLIDVMTKLDEKQKEERERAEKITVPDNPLNKSVYAREVVNGGKRATG